MKATDRHPVSGVWPEHGLERLDRCPVCGWEERREAYSGLRDGVFFCAPGEWQLYRCLRCASLYLDPRPTLDTIGLAYSSYFTHEPSARPAVETMTASRRWQRALANGYRNWRYGTREEPSSALGVLVAYLSPTGRALLDSEFRHLPRVKRGMRLLDVGSGDGGFLQWANAAGWEAVGLDPDRVAVDGARARGLNVRCGTIDVLQDQKSSFDVITLSHVIEHVHDPRAVLRQVYNLLKPGGQLWLDTPNLESIGHQRFGAAWLGLDPPRHLVLFTPGTLRDLLSQVGFGRIRTISRFEVCARVFTASDRIVRGTDPLAEEPVPSSVRLHAFLASWRARLISRRSEFITVMATR